MVGHLKFTAPREFGQSFCEFCGEPSPILVDADGTPNADTNGHSATFVKYSYRSGQFVYYKPIGGNHGLQVGGSLVYADEAKQLVAALLLQ